MEKETKNGRPQGLQDSERTAYMLAWRDRHIEKQNELIRGYEESLSLMEALLAFALWQTGEEENESRVAHVPKKELEQMLHRYVSEVKEGDGEFLVCFSPVQDGEEPRAE